MTAEDVAAILAETLPILAETLAAREVAAAEAEWRHQVADVIDGSWGLVVDEDTLAGLGDVIDLWRRGLVSNSWAVRMVECAVEVLRDTRRQRAFWLTEQAEP